MRKILLEQIKDYRPTKRMWLGSCAACMLGTVLVSFTWGDLVTGKRAEAMAEVSAKLARADLAAEICNYRFLHSPDVRSRLTALQSAGKWERADLVKEEGLVTLVGRNEPIEDAAALCADRLVDLEFPRAVDEQPADAVAERARLLR